MIHEINIDAEAYHNIICYHKKAHIAKTNPKQPFTKGDTLLFIRCKDGKTTKKSRPALITNVESDPWYGIKKGHSLLSFTPLAHGQEIPTEGETGEAESPSK